MEEARLPDAGTLQVQQKENTKISIYSQANKLSFWNWNKGQKLLTRKPSFMIERRLRMMMPATRFENFPPGILIYHHRSTTMNTKINHQRKCLHFEHCKQKRQNKSSNKFHASVFDNQQPGNILYSNRQQYSLFSQWRKKSNVKTETNHQSDNRKKISELKWIKAWKVNSRKIGFSLFDVLFHEFAVKVRAERVVDETHIPVVQLALCAILEDYVVVPTPADLP